MRRKSPSTSFRQGCHFAILVILLAANSPVYADNREVQELKDQMQDQNIESRRGAIWLLARMGPAAVDAVPDLIAATLDENRSVQIQALAALDNIATPDAVQAVEKKIPEVIEFLRAELKLAAAREKALSFIAILGRRAAPLEGDLLALLKTIDPAIKEKLLKTLGAVGGSKTRIAMAETIRDDKNEFADKALEILAQFGADALPDLKQMAKSSNVQLRSRAVRGLFLIGEAARPEADNILSALNSEDPDVRIYAARALGNLKYAKAVDRLISMALPPDGQISFEAAEALQKIGGERSARACATFREQALPILIEKITAPDSVDRAWAIGEAGRLNLFTTGIVAAIVRNLDHPQREIRLAAIHSLALSGDPSHSPLFSKALGDPDARVRFAASNALIKLGGASVPSLIDGLKPNQSRTRRHMAILTLDQLGEAAAAANSELEEMSRDNDPLLSLAAKAALTHIREAAAIPAG